MMMMMKKSAVPALNKKPDIDALTIQFAVTKGGIRMVELFVVELLSEQNR